MPFEPETTGVIWNPVSGSRRSRRRAAEVAARLRALGYGVHPTRAPGSATELARVAAENGKTGVIVLGGDGTLYEAVRDVPPGFALGQFPAGTINLMAAALRVPSDVEGFVELVRARTSRPIRLGVANGRRFVSVGSVGLDAEAVRTVWKPLKRVASRTSYVVATLVRAPVYSRRTFRVELDQGVIEGEICGVLFGRQPYFAQTKRPAHAGADPADEHMAVALLRGAGRLASLVQTARAGTGRPGDPSRRISALTRSLRIESTPPSPVELDGDYYGWTPLELGVEPVTTPFLAPGKAH